MIFKMQHEAEETLCAGSTPSWRRPPRQTLETPVRFPQDSKVRAPLTRLIQLFLRCQAPQQHHLHVMTRPMAHPRAHDARENTDRLFQQEGIQVWQTRHQHDGVRDRQVPISVRKRDEETHPRREASPAYHGSC